jgi:protein-disulfide isomerase
MQKRLIALAVVLGLGASAALAQDASTEQLIKFFRKKNNIPPSAQVTVSGLKDSVIKGAKEGVLDVGPPQPKRVPFTLSSDGKYALFGDTVDLTVDPSKAVMAKIKLDGVACRGPKDAKVTIVKFSDYQCPFCAKGYATMEEVLKLYGDKVRFCFKDFPLPFHPWAEPAAIAAKCVSQQKPDVYWKVYDGFFQNQKDVNPGNVNEKAWSFVEAAGLDKAKFDECVNSKATQAAVKADAAEGQSLGVTGTPSFVINGSLLVGAQPIDAFKAVIDDELASAK